MSISTIGTSSSPADSRSAVKQSEKQSTSGADNGKTRADSQGSAGSTDAVSISSQAADLQALESNIRALPDMDVSRISTVKDKISAGEYQIDSQRLADRILAFEKNL